MRATCALLMCASLASCYTTIGKWTYPSGRYPTATCEHGSSAIVAVEPLDDVRSDTNKSWMTWAYVPLSPLGWTHFDRPEATIPGDDTTRYTANPCDDLARAIAVELEHEHIVEHVEFASDRHHDASCTHVLRGKLRAFYVHESRWAYGLSVYAALLWSLGAPVGESHNGFRADLELVDARDGRVLWNGSVFDADDYIEGFYYGPEWYRFGRLWEMRLREKMGEIAAALGATPAPLPENLSAESRELPPPKVPECLGVDSSTPCSVK